MNEATTQPGFRRRIAAAAEDSSAADWPSIRLLNSYRLFIAISLLAAFLFGVPAIDFGSSAPNLFYALAAAYLVAALVFALMIRQRRPSAEMQAHIQLYGDILVLAGVTYASGGMTSGLGTLLVVPVAGAGTLLALREALFCAALGSLLVLGTEVARFLELGPATTAYPQAALLGITLFAAALLAAALSRRSYQSAELARRRSADVRRLSALNERIVQQMEAGILVIAPDGTVALANASAGALLAHPERVVGQPLDAVAPDLATAFEAWLDNGTAPAEPMTPHDRSDRRLQVQFTPLGEAGTLIALEDAGFIEEQVQQLKLASLGRLTASIAHEIRNPLGAISHSSQLLSESEQLDANDRRLTEIMLSHCRRVNDIIENVLELSRRPRGESSSLELGAWMDEFAVRFAADHGLEPARFGHEPPDRPIPVHFDAGQLEQIVRNLCENSLRHGQRRDGRPVTVTLRTGRDRERNPCLDVVDDGIEIARERIDTMFEPFYTTSHAGTGLGLFLARELCEANRARLRFVRDSGHNTFRISFEAVEEPAQDD